MPKGALHFDLSDEFEVKRFEAAVRAQDLVLAVFRFDEYLRSRAKYGDATTVRYDVVRGQLRQYLEADGINLDDLII